MNEVGALFVVTGEVLGERPMSQHRDALRFIEKESGLRGLILRPLSARLLEPSIPEQRGWVNRERLLSIRGRSRKQQIELAEEFGIVDYPCPAGGCRLTDPQYARRIRESFDHEEVSIRHINLLKYGRHFRLPSGAKVIVGRDEGENAVLETLIPASGFLFTCAEDAEGPVTVLFSYRGVGDFHAAAALTLRYSDFRGLRGKVRMRACNGKLEWLYKTESMPEEVCKQYQIV